jgi:hypothetical protein
MKPLLLLLLFFLMPALAVPERGALAYVRAGANGVPCFTVDAATERLDGTAQFRALSVIDTATRATMWQMALPVGRSFALTHAICIPYAGRVAALPQTPAAALVAGRVYRIALAVRNWEQASRTYTADFCVVGKVQAVASLSAGENCPVGN